MELHKDDQLLKIAPEIKVNDDGTTSWVAEDQFQYAC